MIFSGWESFLNIDNHQYVMERIINLLNAMNDPTRLKILEFLLNGEKCVCEIFPHVKRTQSTTSTQLAKLTKAGILKSRKDGKKVFYRIIDYRFCKVLQILSYAKNKVYSENCCKCQ